MRKYILLTSCLFVGFSAEAATYECKSIPVSCPGYNVTGTCPGNYVACAFNKNAKYCDNEAETGDFKFTLPPLASKNWSYKSSYHGAYIMGYKTGSGTYCSSTIDQKNETTEIQQHNHTADKVSNANPYVGNVEDGDKTSYTTPVKVKDGGNTYQTESSSVSIPVRPISYVVNGYMYGNQPATDPNITVSVPSTEPTCPSLGYIHKTNQCPGDYVVCPLDTAFVLCDLQAQAGEIKFSLRGVDHEGWLRINNEWCEPDSCTKSQKWGGRKLKDITTTVSTSNNYSKSELAKIIKNNYYDLGSFFGTKDDPQLPDYTGMFLQINTGTYTTTNGSKSGIGFGDKMADSVGTHKHDIRYATKVPGSTDSIEDGKDDKVDQYWLYNSLEKSSTSYTTSSNGVGDGTETRPYNYATNVFIYAGLLEVE